MEQAFIAKVSEHYKDTLDNFGASAKGVGWNGDDAQRIRYEMLAKIIKEDRTDRFSICDYGCGVGYGYSFFEANYGEKLERYTGYDYLEEMIQVAQKQLGSDTEKHRFVQGTDIQGRYDYVVSSGVFNLKEQVTDEEWKQYILNTLHQFDEHSAKGFAFNALTIYSDREKMKDDLYYADPMFLFDYCKRHFSRNVAVLHDYELYDFTVLVRK